MVFFELGTAGGIRFKAQYALPKKRLRRGPCETVDFAFFKEGRQKPYSLLEVKWVSGNRTRLKCFDDLRKLNDYPRIARYVMIVGRKRNLRKFTPEDTLIGRKPDSLLNAGKKIADGYQVNFPCLNNEYVACVFRV